MKTTKYILFLTLGSMLFSCVEDEGSYTYTPINEVSIGGIEKSYEALAYFDELEINPEIKGSVNGEDDSDYEYAWYRCRGDNQHTHDTISTERNLKWKADVQPGSYTIYLSVKDKKTGYEELASTSFSATSPYTRGFLILGNRPNSDLVGLDMLTMVPNRDTTYVQNVYDNSETQWKNARELIYSGYTSKSHFFLCTETETHKLTFSSEFTNIGELNELGILAPLVPHKTPMKLVDMAHRLGVISFISASCPRFYMTEDLVFGTRPISGEFQSTASNKYSETSENYFHFYPRLFVNTRKNSLGMSGSYYGPIMLYDTDNDCFAYISTGFNFDCCTALQNSPSHGIWLNNKPYGRKIVYGENDYSTGNGHCYAIMKDNENKYYLYRFCIAFSMWGGIAISNGQTINLDPATLPHFIDHEHIFFSSYYTLMYYSHGKTLYAYDYINNRIESKEFDAPITYLKPEVSSNMNKLTDYWVATYNGSEGHIYKMQSTNNPNKIEFINIPNQDWEVNLEVKSILWKGQSN